MVRSLLARGGVSKTFWPEAVIWSIHILNRSPTFDVRNMTAEEAWSGRIPAVDHFRIFGCMAYAHVPNVRRKKLDDKAEKCFFLSVSEASKAFKLFNPLTKKIVISRDVVLMKKTYMTGMGSSLPKFLLKIMLTKSKFQLLLGLKMKFQQPLELHQ